MAPKRRNPSGSAAASARFAGVRRLNLSGTSAALRAKLARVRIFLCDVDGILTDGGVYLGKGIELKRFNILDGLGLRLLQLHGIPVGWISNRPSTATVARAKELKIDFLFQQREGTKTAAVSGILKKAGLTFADLCYMGDDIVDLAVLRRAAVAVSVPNGIVETRQMADYVTRKAGGDGAVREVCDLILKAQHRWKPLIEKCSV